MGESPNSVFLAKFTNGILKSQKGSEVTFGAFEDKQEKRQQDKKRKLILVAESGEHTYVGQNFGELHSKTSQQCRYMIGIRNGESGKMTIHDAEILNMKPHRDNNDSDDDTKNNRTYTEKIDNLTAAFGSRRKKRAMDKRHKNQLTSGKLKDAVDTAVDKTLLRDNVDELLAEVKPQSATENIPSHDTEALTPAAAYPLDQLITAIDMEGLKSVSMSFVTCKKEQISEWEKEKKYPNIIIRHLKVLPIKEDARLRKACMLMYLHYMFVLYGLNAIQIKKNKSKLFGALEIPASVEKTLKQNFSLKLEGSVLRTMPSRLKDKLVCYILVLCLHLDEFSLEVDSTLQDLRLTKSKIQSCTESKKENMNDEPTRRCVTE